MTLDKYDFWRMFSRAPKYKERETFNGRSREDIIDALLAAEQALEDKERNSSESYSDMVDEYDADIIETARLTTIETEDTLRKNSQTIADLKANHKAEVAALVSDHTLELARVALETEFASEKKVKDAEDRATEAEKKFAVSESQNKIYKELIDLNGDILDIKEITGDIIKKLPTINLTSLPSHTTHVKEK